MPLIRKRVSECILCTKLVTESIEQHIDADMEIPDQNNCDFSEYKNYKVIGGVVLLKKIPDIRGFGYDKPVPVVCRKCLTGRKVQALVDYILMDRYNKYL